MFYIALNFIFHIILYFTLLHILCCFIFHIIQYFFIISYSILIHISHYSILLHITHYSIIYVSYIKLFILHKLSILFIFDIVFHNSHCFIFFYIISHWCFFHINSYFTLLLFYLFHNSYYFI